MEAPKESLNEHANNNDESSQLSEGQFEAQSNDTSGDETEVSEAFEAGGTKHISFSYTCAKLLEQKKLQSAAAIHQGRCTEMKYLKDNKGHLDVCQGKKCSASLRFMHISKCFIPNKYFANIEKDTCST